jgi:Tol biopolymer transport system component
MDHLALASPTTTSHETRTNRRPAWSRDGQYLAYYSSRSPSGLPNPGTNPTVLVIRTVGTGVERVVPLPVGVVNNPLSSGPKWFPDNRSVLIQSRDAQGPGLGFYRLDLDTARTELLWSVTHNGRFSLDLSPDGRSIFLNSSLPTSGQPSGPRTPRGRLMRIDLDSRRETVLKQDEWFIELAVSPDGAELAYLKTVRKDTTEYASILEVMPTAGGPSREVYRHPFWYDGSRYNTLAWTAD